MAWLLYSRRGCHLCEAAEDMLAARVPSAVVVDVDAHPGTRERLGLRVPVLEIDGVVAMEGRFDELQLARLCASRSEA